MSLAKAILVVGDGRSAVSGFLSVGQQTYQVVTVPSAEQGVFELRLSSFALLVTSRRLPGMDGFDLVEQAKRIDADLPVLMVTDGLSAAERRRGEVLGVQAYLLEPLDQEGVLTAVSTLLNLTIDKAASEGELETDPALPLTLIRNRLVKLGNDTGASGLFLADIAGEIVVQEIDTPPSRQWPQIIRRQQQMMQQSLALADEANSARAFSLHYHAFDTFKLYSANVGRHYFLGMYFDNDRRVGGISSVSVFTRRAIEDLLPLLNEDEGAGEHLIETAELVAQDHDEADSEKPLHRQIAPAANLLEPPETVPLTESEMAQLLSLDFEATPQTADLDAFWSDAAEDDGATAGLSLEEAKRQGLIPSELQFEED